VRPTLRESSSFLDGIFCPVIKPWTAVNCSQPQSTRDRGPRSTVVQVSHCSRSWSEVQTGPRYAVQSSRKPELDQTDRGERWFGFSGQLNRAFLERPAIFTKNEKTMKKKSLDGSLCCLTLVKLVTTGATHQTYVTSSDVPNTSDDDRHTESQLIRAVTRPRPITACSGQLVLRQKGGGNARGGGGTHTVFSVVNSIRSSSLYTLVWNGRCTILTAHIFFRCFLLRGPIRKSRTWRSAARVGR
jgi:hypothetical protein